jgi:hypothetical protein
MSVAAVGSLLGLRMRKTRLLLGWMLFLLLSFFPEAGMVLYMAVYYWVSSLSMLSMHNLNNVAAAIIDFVAVAAVPFVVVFSHLRMIHEQLWIIVLFLVTFVVDIATTVVAFVGYLVFVRLLLLLPAFVRVHHAFSQSVTFIYAKTTLEV